MLSARVRIYPSEQPKTKITTNMIFEKSINPNIIGESRKQEQIDNFIFNQIFWKWSCIELKKMEQNVFCSSCSFVCVRFIIILLRTRQTCFSYLADRETPTCIFGENDFELMFNSFSINFRQKHARIHAERARISDFGFPNSEREFRFLV